MKVSFSGIDVKLGTKSLVLEGSHLSFSWHFNLQTFISTIGNFTTPFRSLFHVTQQVDWWESRSYRGVLSFGRKAFKQLVSTRRWRRKALEYYLCVRPNRSSVHLGNPMVTRCGAKWANLCGFVAELYLLNRHLRQLSAPRVYLKHFGVSESGFAKSGPNVKMYMELFSDYPNYFNLQATATTTRIALRFR